MFTKKKCFSMKRKWSSNIPHLNTELFAQQLFCCQFYNSEPTPSSYHYLVPSVWLAQGILIANISLSKNIAKTINWLLKRDNIIHTSANEENLEDCPSVYISPIRTFFRYMESVGKSYAIFTHLSYYLWLSRTFGVEWHYS